MIMPLAFSLIVQTEHVTLPFEMSWMDTPPLSRCGFFSKGASTLLIWGFQQNQIAPSFSMRNSTPYARKVF